MRRPASCSGRATLEEHRERARHRRAGALSGPAVRAGRVGRRGTGQQRRSTSAAPSAAASSPSTPSTGALVWKTYTIAAEAKPIGKNPSGRRAGGRRAPASGRRRRSMRSAALVYAATGNMYTEPQQATSDAVMAFDLDTGRSVDGAGHAARRVRRRLQQAERGAIVRRRASWVRISTSATRRCSSKLADGKRDDRHRPEVRHRLGDRSRQARHRGLAIPGGRRAARSAAWSADRPSTPSTRISRWPTATALAGRACTPCS